MLAECRPHTGDELRPFRAPGIAVAAEHRGEAEPDDRRAEDGRLADGPVDRTGGKAGAHHRRHAEAGETILQRAKLSIAHICEPRLEDLQCLGAELRSNLDETLEPAPPRIDARRSRPRRLRGCSPSD